MLTPERRERIVRMATEHGANRAAVEQFIDEHPNVNWEASNAALAFSIAVFTNRSVMATKYATAVVKVLTDAGVHDLSDLDILEDVWHRAYESVMVGEEMTFD